MRKEGGRKRGGKKGRKQGGKEGRREGRMEGGRTICYKQMTENPEAPSKGTENEDQVGIWPLG